jgi:hypothetical protein
MNLIFVPFLTFRLSYQYLLLSPTLFGAPWIADGGLNAIVHVDPLTEKVRVFSLPVVEERKVIESKSIPVALARQMDN